VDDFWVTIVKRVTQVVIMVNYVYEHDFIYGCIHIGEEASSHALKTSTKSSNPKYVYLWVLICTYAYGIT